MRQFDYGSFGFVTLLKILNKIPKERKNNANNWVPIVCLELQLELVELLVQLPQVPVHQPNDKNRFLSYSIIEHLMIIF